MPHNIHPFAVMFRDRDSYATYMSRDAMTLAEWLQGVSPQAEILDAIVDWKECRFSCIGELMAFLQPDIQYEQMTFL